MLPAGARLRSGREIATVVRGGVVGRGPSGVTVTLRLEPGAPSRAAFAVPKQVGSAVTRNQVRRRLRHLLRAEWATLPSGAQLVVRADPMAAAQSSRALGVGLRRALDAAIPRARRVR
ncbi:MAG: ribonuclease P protein component [Mycobacteriales bacterium]